MNCDDKLDECNQIVGYLSALAKYDQFKTLSAFFSSLKNSRDQAVRLSQMKAA